MSARAVWNAGTVGGARGWLEVGLEAVFAASTDMIW